MSKTRVAVLRGGPSEEYTVSLRTGDAVLRALDRERYEPVDVVITKNGEWLINGVARYPENIIRVIDVAFLALHGTYGEDGTVQRLLDRFTLPYTGSKAYASAVAMNKALAKQHLRDTGIKTPHHMVVSSASRGTLHDIVTRIGSLFGPQYFVKPLSSGSSVGTTYVKSIVDLSDVLLATLDGYEQVLVEERIEGREATCAVVERYRGQDLYALPPIEIVPPPSAEFFDNTVKYNDATQEICPSRFSNETKREIEEASKLVHQTLGLSQYSRSDFIVAPDGLYFLEVNTLPGLTPQSLLPKALAAVGATYPSFIEHLITDALAHS